MQPSENAEYDSEFVFKMLDLGESHELHKIMSILHKCPIFLFTSINLQLKYTLNTKFVVTKF